MTAGEGYIGNCDPDKTKVKLGFAWVDIGFLRSGNFQCYRVVQLMKNIVYILFRFKTIQVKWIFDFIFRSQIIQTLIRRQSESMVNRTSINSAQAIFILISPSSNNITRWGVQSRVRAWSHDSSGYIDFYQMSLISQSEWNILLLKL